MIDIHHINKAGVYLNTTQIDPRAVQPQLVVYEPLPEPVDGFTPVWNGTVWNLVLNNELPVHDETSELLEAQKVFLNNQLAALEEKAINQGAPYDFGTPYGILHVQLRDGDRTNLIGIRMKCLEDENYQTTFRTFENVNVPVDATSGYVLSEHGLNSYITIKGTAWSLKDAIKNAAVLEDLPSIPESLI